MARDEGRDLHSQIIELLLDKVRTDPYPSGTVLDLIEENMRGEEVREYAEALMEKVSEVRFPSLDHLRRLIELA